MCKHTLLVILQLFILYSATCKSAGAAPPGTDCESVLPALCKLNGAGSHCHPCVASAYVECKDSNTPELKSCPSGQLWDTLLSQCKPDSWIQPRHSECQPGTNLAVPKGFQPTASSAAVVATAAAALSAAEAKIRAHIMADWQTLMARASAVVQDLTRHTGGQLAGASQQQTQQQKRHQQSAQEDTRRLSLKSRVHLQPRQHQQQQQQQQQLKNLAVRQQKDEARLLSQTSSTLRTSMLTGGSSSSGKRAAQAPPPPAAAAAKVGDAASGYEELLTNVQQAIEGAALLQETAETKAAAAELAEQLAATQIAAIKGALSSAEDVAAVAELENGIALAEQVQTAAAHLRAEAKELSTQAEAQAAAVADALNLLTVLDSQQKPQKKEQHQKQPLLKEQQPEAQEQQQQQLFKASREQQVKKQQLTLEQKQQLDTKHSPVRQEPEQHSPAWDVRQQQQSSRQQESVGDFKQAIASKGAAPAFASPSKGERQSAGQGTAQDSSGAGQQRKDDTPVTADADKPEPETDAATLKAAMDLAAAANKVVQELMAKTASGPLLGGLGAVATAKPTDTNSSGSKQRSPTSQPPAKEQPAPVPKEGLSDRSSSSSSSSSSRTPEQLAAEDALARDLLRKRALEAVLGSEYDFSALFTVDEGSPQGRPVDNPGRGSESDVRSGAVASPAPAQQQQQQQQQQQKKEQQEEEEDLDDSPAFRVDEFSPQGRTLEPGHRHSDAEGPAPPVGWSPAATGRALEPPLGGADSHSHAEGPAPGGWVPAASRPQEPRQQEEHMPGLQDKPSLLPPHQQENQHQQQQEQQSGGEQPSTARPDSLVLAVSYHKHLVQAAAHLSSGPPGAIADAQTGAQVEQLVRLFSSVLPSLSAERRVDMLRLAPEAAVAVFSDGDKGAPVVRLEPTLARILAPTDAAQLEAVLTTQVQDIHSHLVHQAQVLEDAFGPHDEPRPRLGDVHAMHQGGVHAMHQGDVHAMRHEGPALQGPDGPQAVHPMGEPAHVGTDAAHHPDSQQQQQQQQHHHPGSQQQQHHHHHPDNQQHQPHHPDSRQQQQRQQLPHDTEQNDGPDPQADKTSGHFASAADIAGGPGRFTADRALESNTDGRHPQQQQQLQQHQQQQQALLGSPERHDSSKTAAQPASPDLLSAHASRLRIGRARSQQASNEGLPKPGFVPQLTQADNSQPAADVQQAAGVQQATARASRRGRRLRIGRWAQQALDVQQQLQQQQGIADPSAGSDIPAGTSFGAYSAAASSAVGIASSDSLPAQAESYLDGSLMQAGDHQQQQQQEQQEKQQVFASEYTNQPAKQQPTTPADEPVLVITAVQVVAPSPRKAPKGSVRVVRIAAGPAPPSDPNARLLSNYKPVRARDPVVQPMVYRPVAVST